MITLTKVQLGLYATFFFIAGFAIGCAPTAILLYYGIFAA